MLLENPHIFYTDDDEDDQELFKDALSEVDARLQLTTADNGDILLSLLESPPPVPRLIFLDLNMPKRNGYEVLERMRQDERLKNYPVIVFSTTSSDEAVKRTRELGANMFVTKPRSYSGMKQAIKTCVEMDWPDFTRENRNYKLQFN
jgi:CheY-like chemotaxis protein